MIHADDNETSREGDVEIYAFRGARKGMKQDINLGK
jgi:hypothetical protein